MPTILVIAGPNGAGKTTFANQLSADQRLDWPYLNADEIGRDELPHLAAYQGVVDQWALWESREGGAILLARSYA